MREMTPERIAQEQLVIDAMHVIYDDATHDRTMQMLRVAGRPSDVLAQATATIIRDVCQCRDCFSPDATLPAGQQVLEMLAELARVAGVFDVEYDRAEMDLARQMVIGKLTN